MNPHDLAALKKMIEAFVQNIRRQMEETVIEIDEDEEDDMIIYISSDEDEMDFEIVISSDDEPML